MAIITNVDVADIRFQTSKLLDGSDAMNPDPDYSAAYLRIYTSDGDVGYSFVFSIGRGNDIQTTAVRVVAERLVGRDVDEVCEQVGTVAHELLWDSQLRWLGPDKGVMHMASGAVINAVWDLRSRREKLPLWASLAQLSPAQLVGLVDWTYISDFLDPGLARETLEERSCDRKYRLSNLKASGLPAYTTSPGWLGYDDEKLARLSHEAVDDGFSMIKLKVGASHEADLYRLGIARDAVGPNVDLAIDASQRWGVNQAIDAIRALQQFDLHWVEEPTHPDDLVGHAHIANNVSPTSIATGEHLSNPVMAKQLLQLDAIDVLQIDATRVGGVPDLLAMLLLAAHAEVLVCPHAGGVGLCEAVQHVAFFNYLAISPTTDGLTLEYVDHLHEHMGAPVELRDGAYQLPTGPGAGTAFNESVLEDFGYPNGREWK